MVACLKWKIRAHKAVHHILLNMYLYCATRYEHVLYCATRRNMLPSKQSVITN